MNYQMQASGKVNKPLRPKVHLECDFGQKISAVKFASFGTPEGVCGSYRQGSCHAQHSYDAFNRVCCICLLYFILLAGRLNNNSMTELWLPFVQPFFLIFFGYPIPIYTKLSESLSPFQNNISSKSMLDKQPRKPAKLTFPSSALLFYCYSFRCSMNIDLFLCPCSFVLVRTSAQWL